MGHAFPYFAAAGVTWGVGTVASVVLAAQAPPAPHAFPFGMHAAPSGLVGGDGGYAVVSAGNAANTPASTPVAPGQAYVAPGFSVGQQAGTGGVPGTPSFTEGFNRGVVPPNRGASPMTPYPNYTQGPMGSPSSPGALAPQLGFGAATQVGFYNGFGGGQPDFGFYSGMTTPR